MEKIKNIKQLGKITAVIPVRSGSTRCKNKNYRDFGDTNLLKLKIETLKKVKTIDKILVSSNCDIMLGVAKKFGVNIHKRDEKFCTSNCSGTDLYLALANAIDTDILLMTFCVTPFVSVETFEKCINNYKKKNCDSISTSYNFKHYLWYNNKPVNYDYDNSPPTQNLPDYVVPSYGIHITDRYSILKNKFRLYYYTPIVLSFIVFIIGGFRYRLVYLVIAMATMYYLFTKKRIKIWFWIIFTFFFVLSMGIMGVSREYSRGLDLSKTEGLELASTALEAVNEANTFFLTGSLIENTIKSGDYLYFEPLVTAIAMPLPRSIFPDKPSGDYLKKIQRDLFGSDQSGAAFLNYGEAFLSFGWIGIFIHGLLIGFLAKLFWVNFLRNRENIMAIASLALFNGFTYIMISRGYFSAHLIFFFYYILIPIWISKTLSKLTIKK
jgi:CMP-N-acetylneuraminic acid synthetase